MKMRFIYLFCLVLSFSYTSSFLPTRHMAFLSPKSMTSFLRQQEMLTELKKGERILNGYAYILSDKGNDLLAELKDFFQGAWNDKKALELISRIPKKASFDLSLIKEIGALYSEKEISALFDMKYGGTAVPIQINKGCPNQCAFCGLFSGKKYSYMSYPVVLKLMNMAKQQGADLLLLYHDSDPFHYRDDVMDANLADVIREMNELGLNTYLTTNGWDIDDTQANRAGEEVTALLGPYNPNKLRVSYHFFYRDFIDALAKKDQQGVEFLYQKFKIRYKNVIARLIKNAKNPITIEFRTIDGDLRNSEDFPLVLKEVEDLQTKAWQEIKDELQIRDAKDGRILGLFPDQNYPKEKLLFPVKVNEQKEDNNIFWGAGRGRQTLERLGFDLNKLPKSMMHFIQPDGYAAYFEPNGNINLRIVNGCAIKDIMGDFDKDTFLDMINVFKVILTAKEPSQTSDERINVKLPLERFQRKWFSHYMNDCTHLRVRKIFFDYLRKVLLLSYPDLIQKIKNLSLDQLKEQEMQDLYSQMKDIAIPQPILYLDSKVRLPFFLKKGSIRRDKFFSMGIFLPELKNRYVVANNKEKMHRMVISAT